MNRIKLFFFNRFALNAYISQDYPKALFWYEKILNTNTERVGLMHNIGLCHFAMNDYDNAETFLLEELSRYGDTDGRLRTLGDLYYRWKKGDQALVFYRRLHDYLNQDECWLKIRIALLENGAKTQKALCAADRLDEALEKMKCGLADDARNLLELGAEEDPSSFQILNNLGIIALQEDNDAAKAVSFFEQAEKLMPIPMHRANLKKARSIMLQE